MAGNRGKMGGLVGQGPALWVFRLGGGEETGIRLGRAVELESKEWETTLASKGNKRRSRERERGREKFQSGESLNLQTKD